MRVSSTPKSTLGPFSGSTPFPVQTWSTLFASGSRCEESIDFYHDGNGRKSSDLSSMSQSRKTLVPWLRDGLTA